MRYRSHDGARADRRAYRAAHPELWPKRRWGRAFACALALSLLLPPLAYGLTWLFAWAWNDGWRRVFPHASVLSLVHVWQVWIVALMLGGAAVGGCFLARDALTWWRGR